MLQPCFELTDVVFEGLLAIRSRAFLELAFALSSGTPTWSTNWPDTIAFLGEQRKMLK